MPQDFLDELHQNSELLTEYNNYVLNELGDHTIIPICCIVSSEYIFDFLIFYYSICNSWTFTKFEVHVFSPEAETVKTINSFRLDHVFAHNLPDDTITHDWSSCCSLKTKIVEFSGLERAIVSDVDNIFLSETPELYLHLENNDMIFIGAPHSEFILQTNLFAFRNSASSIEFSKIWHEESKNRRFSDASGLPFALLRAKGKEDLKIKTLVREKISGMDHHQCPYDVQANVPPFRLTQDHLGFQENQMGRAKVLHFGGIRCEGNDSVLSRAEVLWKKFPDSATFFEYYIDLANKAANVLGWSQQEEAIDILSRVIDPNRLPKDSNLRRRLVNCAPLRNVS